MRREYSSLLRWLGVALAALSLGFLIFGTPGGFLRKLDYIGAAVCHRRASHSFFIAGHQLPVCQRCTGTFSGALTGILVHWGLWKRRRSQRFPRWPFFILPLIFAVLWVLDGLNSSTADIGISLLPRLGGQAVPGAGLLGYVPQPWLRLLTGTMMGLSMSLVLVPAFNQALWSDGEEKATLKSGREFIQLLVIEGGVAGLILLLQGTSSRLALYVVASYTIAGVIAMFTLLGAMIFVLALHRENTVAGWQEAWVPLVWGVVFTALVVGFMDAARLWITGTIDGVPGLS